METFEEFFFSAAPEEMKQPCTLGDLDIAANVLMTLMTMESYNTLQFCFYMFCLLL